MTRRRSTRGDADEEQSASTSEPLSKRLALTLAAPLGQGAALLRHLRAARRLELHHALVIGGPAGSGKSTIARWLAAALLCPSDLDRDGPCGVCRTCRKVASGQHADLHLLTPEPDKREIKVDAVRALLDALLHQPVEGRARVVIVDPASALNLEGQNALLKTLEEPGRATFLLLATARPEALLPTVRSRTERLGVRRLADALLALELSRRFPNAAKDHARAIATARGCLGAALAALTEQAVQLQDLVQEVGDGSSPLRAVATARQALAAGEGSAGAQQQARAFLAALRQTAAARMRALASDGSASYLPLASDPWTTLLELTLCAEQDLDLQIPPGQVLVGLLLQWSRARNGSG